MDLEGFSNNDNYSTIESDSSQKESDEYNYIENFKENDSEKVLDKIIIKDSNEHLSEVNSKDIQELNSQEPEEVKHRQEHPLGNWNNKKPVDYYITIVNSYGEPKILSNVPGGICIWTRDQLEGSPFEELILRDEEVEHCVPSNHSDFFYTYIKVYIPPEKIHDVMSISGSVNYDPLKKLLFARCGSIEANIATLYTVLMTMDGYQQSYANNIRESGQMAIRNLDTIVRLLSRNSQEYSRELTYKYHPAASPRGCNPKKVSEADIDTHVFIVVALIIAFILLKN
jgi:hypothetical protein